jgi:lysophospholipase L1-like esterase
MQVKLKLYASIWACMMGLSCVSQTYDSGFYTTYYEQKVSLFRLLPVTNDDIVFIGNSITDIGEWAEIWQTPRVKNRGISSDNTFGVLARLDEVTARKPAKLFIMIGINDLAKGIPVEVILRNYGRVVEQVQEASPRTHIYIQSLLPTNADFPQFVRHQHKHAEIAAVNKGLIQLAQDKKVVFVHLHDAFLDAEGKLSPAYTNDGLHLNGAGYMLWKQILEREGHCCK